MQQKDDCQRSGRHFARLTVSTLLLAGALTLQPAHAGCSTKSLKGLYGLTTQGINANGIYLTTLSVFDFQPGNGPNGQNQVTEDYFVATANRQTGGTAYGNYQVDSSCHFNLSVVDLTGVRYALEGEVSPNQHKVVVMQTSDSREGVAVGTMQAVGRRSCQPSNFRGDYTFLSDGRIPDNSGQPASWSESLVGRFRATGYGFVQPVELTNTNGVISEAPPRLCHCQCETQLPSGSGRLKLHRRLDRARPTDALYVPIPGHSTPGKRYKNFNRSPP